MFGIAACICIHLNKLLTSEVLKDLTTKWSGGFDMILVTTAIQQISSPIGVAWLEWWTPSLPGVCMMSLMAFTIFVSDSSTLAWSFCCQLISMELRSFNFFESSVIWSSYESISLLQITSFVVTFLTRSRAEFSRKLFLIRSDLSRGYGVGEVFQSLCERCRCQLSSHSHWTSVWWFVFFEFSTDYEEFDSLYVGLMTCDYSIL